VGFYNNLGDDEGGRIVEVFTGSGTFLRCRFIHDNRMQRREAELCHGVQRRDLSLFSIETGTGLVRFDDCDFENLISASLRDSYLFSRWGTVSHFVNLGMSSVGSNIELHNSRITFRQGERLGLYAGFSAHLIVNSSPVPADRLLMDNVTIRNNGSTQQLFCLTGNSPAGSFLFRPNNVYYAPSGARVPLSTAGAFTGLGSGVVRLQQGAVPRVAW